MDVLVCLSCVIRRSTSMSCEDVGYNTKYIRISEHMRMRSVSEMKNNISNTANMFRYLQMAP